MERPLRVQVVSPSELPGERRRRGGGRRGREGGIGRVNTFSDGSAWDALFVFKSYLLQSYQGRGGGGEGVGGGGREG